MDINVSKVKILIEIAFDFISGNAFYTKVILVFEILPHKSQFPTFSHYKLVFTIGNYPPPFTHIFTHIKWQFLGQLSSPDEQFIIWAMGGIVLPMSRELGSVTPVKIFTMFLHIWGDQVILKLKYFASFPFVKVIFTQFRWSQKSCKNSPSVLTMYIDTTNSFNLCSQTCETTNLQGRMLDVFKIKYV